jgi:nucleoside transporter
MTDAPSAGNSLSAKTPSRTPFGVGAGLSMMMLLQYAVWGVWLPYLSRYLQAEPILNDSGARVGGGLGFSGSQVGWILGIAGSIGAVTAPFIAGQIADRFINAEKYLGILLILGGIFKYITFYQESFEGFLTFSILYSVAYMPTLALTNSIAFANLSKPEAEFPLVRTWGTIGWILASNLFPLLWMANIQGFGFIPTPEQAAGGLNWIPPFFQVTEEPDAVARIADALRVSGVLAVLYGIWAMLMLPKTPPKRSNEHPLAFLRAFGEFTRPGLLVVTLAALPISMIHQVYFFRTAPFLQSIGFADVQTGPIMSIGQVSEIAFLALLGFTLKALGFKWVMVIGCAAYAVRFGLFALATPELSWLAPTANILHGLCYGFFFATAFMYVDRVTTPDVRHSAQTVFGIIILGAGPVLAGFYNQFLDTLGTPEIADAPFNYEPVWWVQAAIGAACMLLVLAAFRLDPANADDAGSASTVA